MAIRKINIEDREFKIYYEIVNQKSKASIIFLHGWGSSSEVMKVGFRGKFKSFKEIYIDLAGFGKSENNYPLKTIDYAKIVSKLLNELNISKDIIVGHSFGGKVATLLEPKLLVLLSSAGILEPKPWSIKLKIKTYKLFKNLGLKNFRSLFSSKDVEGMSESMYQTFKNVVDEDFSSEFKKFNSKALIFWGDEDRATTLKSGEKIASLIQDSKFFKLKGEHYFFLEHREYISKTIESEYGKL